ncbi:predicted protein [Uncinocarpus reesii 1704]|uniref:HNH nuclease domain-containing protein n=1 Tax=Uncinocarpus reesii (strain UAMH 1704) TaxID=336963 RepID=C4JQD9_UNCRE|nr:uncharacterized protein UREG_04693 [Uncinocarpus reesii 1704]EEP79847.1 predicted protein [Uncinocarpus reesii 1704]
MESFEGLIDYSSLVPLTAGERSRAQEALNEIIDHVASYGGIKCGYSHHLLVLHSYNNSQSEPSKDTFLRTFFNIMGRDISSNEDINVDDDQILSKFIHFADMLLEQFFVPSMSCTTLRASNPHHFQLTQFFTVKASGRILTPQPSPAQLSAIQSIQSPHEIMDTSERISHLRALCLVRDQHRCVISRAFDSQEALTRMKHHGLDAQDDEGRKFDNSVRFSFLEVAHITNSPFSAAGKRKVRAAHGMQSAWPTIFHKHFGDFEIYFEPIDGQEHTYHIKGFLPPIVRASLGLPVTRKLLFSEGRAVHAPLPKLLALHRAIAHIFHLSGAGEYIDKILGEFEERGVQEDGSTDLGRIVNLRLGGWFDDEVH